MNAQPLRRAARRGAVATVLLAALVTSGCAAGRYAATAHEKATIDGTDVNIGHIALRGLSVAAPSGNPYYFPGSAARINLVLINNGQHTDHLIGIRSTSATGWAAFNSASTAEGVRRSAESSAANAPVGGASGPSASSSGQPSGNQSVAIPPGNRVSFGVPDATGGLLLLGMRGKVYPGSDIAMTFQFAGAGTLHVQVPVDVTSTPGSETVGA